MKRVPGDAPILNTARGVDVFLFRTAGDELVYRPCRASIEEQIPDSISDVEGPDDLAEAIEATQGEFLHLASARVIHPGYTIKAMRVGICFPRATGEHVCFAHTVRYSALEGAVILPRGPLVRCPRARGRREVWRRYEMQITQPPLAESPVLCGLERPVPIPFGLSMKRSLYALVGGFPRRNAFSPCAGQEFVLRLLAHGVHFHSTPYVAALYLE